MELPFLVTLVPLFLLMAVTYPSIQKDWEEALRQEEGR